MEINTMRRRKGFVPYRKRKNKSTLKPNKTIQYLLWKNSANQKDLRIKRLQKKREKEDERRVEETRYSLNEDNLNVWVVCKRLEDTHKKNCLKVDTDSIPGLMFLSWKRK